MLNKSMIYYVISSLKDIPLPVDFIPEMYHGKMTKIREISQHSVIDIDIRNINFLIYIHVYIDQWEIHRIEY